MTLADGPGNDRCSVSTGASLDFVTLNVGAGKDQYTLDTGDDFDGVIIVDAAGKDRYTGIFGAGDDTVEVTDALGKDTYELEGGPDTGSQEGDTLLVTDPFADGDKDLLNGWESGTGFNQGP